MRTSSINIWLFAVLIFPGIVNAQLVTYPIDSLLTGNYLRTNFLNDINLSGLNTVLNYNLKSGRTGLRINEYYQSNVSKLARNFTRDYNDFSAVAYYSVNSSVDAGIGFRNVFLTDDKDIEANRNNSSYIFSNIDYLYSYQLRSNVRAGYKKEDQIGEKNSGFSGLLSANADNYFIDDYLLNGSLVLAYENLQGKMNHNYDAGIRMFKSFTARSDNTGDLRYYNTSNDFYFPASPSVVVEFGVKNNIERRSENFFFAGDVLNYRFNDFSGMSLSGGYINRIIKKEYKYRSSSANALLDNVYDNKIAEENLELAAALDINYGRMFLTGKMFYIERSENHTLTNIAGLTPGQISELEKAERNKNNNSRRTGLFGDVKYSISNTNYVSAAGSISLLRYDTEYTENYDDRDELEVNLYVLHGYNNLRNFDIETKFDYIKSSLNYIFAQRSANNYNNYIYRLSSLSNFSPVKNLTTRNFLQVLANYTVYDFEDVVSQVQSFSYRQLMIRDSTTYRLSGNWELKFNGEIRIYEQGQFNNSEFSVKPISYFEEQFYSPEIVYLPLQALTVSAGFRYFQQTRYNYEGTSKTVTGIYKTLGPYGKIFLYLNNASIINLTCGLDHISYSAGNSSSESLNISLSLLWNM